MKKILLLSFTSLLFTLSLAQVGINILEPDSSAVLHLESTDRGFLLPRMDDTQMRNIQNPANGLMVYNLSDSLVYYWNNDCWLKVYLKDCNQCEFNASLSSNGGVIDHITSDSVSFDVNILQTNGNSDISVSYFFVPPSGMNISITNPIIDSAGTATFNISADIFTTPGTYSIVVLVTCDQTAQFLTYLLELPPCYQVNLAANTTNVNVQSDFSLPGVGTPICVIVDVFNGVDVTSLNASNAAITWGALDPNSHVGLRNNGAIFARGGDGSSLGNILNLTFAAPGGNGGDALILTAKTTFALNGPIYGGGGGGGSIGTALDVSTPIPLLGSLGICLAAGSGGGGGSASGIGGGLSGACTGSGPLYFPFTFVEDGQNATAGANSVPGLGGVINQSFPISFNATVATITITPSINVSGGNGGDFGQPGGAGNGSVTVTLGVSFPIPFLPSINIPIGPFTLISSAGGAAGIAIKTNNNTTVNLITPNNFIKGAVQP